ncbi:hypothetical protein E2C01_041912 [Portunus trituberculatus]|uniref:Uncharacterized protein n=1 Tax=Portunus trituberculatus TaxID=210409 RepID=A0A5B7FRY8_PORTR|nr:hypothetical protein [Portunus trituberculatus]
MVQVTCIRRVAQETGCVVRLVCQDRNLPQRSVAESQPRPYHIVFSDSQAPAAVLEAMVMKCIIVLNGDAGRPLIIRPDAEEIHSIQDTVQLTECRTEMNWQPTPSPARFWWFSVRRRLHILLRRPPTQIHPCVCDGANRWWWRSSLWCPVLVVSAGQEGKLCMWECSELPGIAASRVEEEGIGMASFPTEKTGRVLGLQRVKMRLFSGEIRRPHEEDEM